MGGISLFPSQASTIAPQVDLTLLILIGLSGFFTTIVVFLIFYFSIRYRRRNQVDRSNPPTTSLRIELGWVFGLLFLAMGTYTWAAYVYFNMSRPPGDSMEVYVVGLQWMWKFQHPEGPSEINTLHVPVGRPVKLIMISQDVIHSLFIPSFRMKYDVIPGRYTNLWFEATRVGEYHIFCAEYCGTLHSQMIGTVIVMEPWQYEDWLTGAGTTGGQVGVPVAEAGQELYQQLGCSGCHAQGAGVQAPALEGIFGQQVPLADGGSVTADESYLRESILLPQEKIVAGYDPIMPAYEGRISEEQLLELVAYIKSLGGDAAPGDDPGPENPSEGDAGTGGAVTQP